MRSALHNNANTYDGSYPEVVFSDFASKTGGQECVPATWPDDRLSVPEGLFEAVVQSVQLLNHEALTTHSAT